MVNNKEFVNKLVLENQRLVHYCVSLFRKRNYITDKIFEDDDLISAGMLGLIRAAQGYDVSKNVKFSTYAFPHIYRNLQLLLYDYSNVKVYDDVRRKIKKYTDFCIRYKESNGQFPSNEVAALELNVSKEQICKFQSFMGECVSLNSLTLTDDNDGELIEVISIGNEDVCDIALSRFMSNDIKNTLEVIGLSLEEIDFLFMLYGVYDKHDFGRKKVSVAYGVTVEAVRQREKRIINRIRNSPKLFLLKELLYEESSSYGKCLMINK